MRDSSTASSPLEEIKLLFGQIDSLQSQVLSQIKLVSVGQSESDTEPLQLSRDATVKAATALIQKIPDLIRLIDLKVSQLPQSVVSEHYLQETLDLYQGKLKHLRRKLKDSQLAAYSEENALIHQQRLREYCPAKSADENDSAESTDQRSALFAGRSAPNSANDKTKTIGEQILTQNKNITSSLQKSKQLMTMSVMQTELNIDTLDQQSKDLTQLNSKLIDMEAVLGKSRQIVKFIEKQDKKDKRRIYAAIGFLLLCSAWVIWRRVLKMPVRILVWTLLKMFGVVNWATSITARDNVSGVTSMSVLAESATHLANTVASMDTPQTQWDTSETHSNTLSSPQIDSRGTDVSTTITSTEESRILAGSTDHSGTFVQDISESSILTWDGPVSQETREAEMSSIWDEEATLIGSANGSGEESDEENDINIDFSIGGIEGVNHMYSTDDKDINIIPVEGELPAETRKVSENIPLSKDIGPDIASTLVEPKVLTRADPEIDTATSAHNVKPLMVKEPTLEKESEILKESRVAYIAENAQESTAREEKAYSQQAGVRDSDPSAHIQLHDEL